MQDIQRRLAAPCRNVSVSTDKVGLSAPRFATLATSHRFECIPDALNFCVHAMEVGLIHSEYG